MKLSKRFLALAVAAMTAGTMAVTASAVDDCRDLCGNAGQSAGCELHRRDCGIYSQGECSCGAYGSSAPSTGCQRYDNSRTQTGRHHSGGHHGRC